MKTTKKIFAAFIAVLMIALMVPFSASAEEEYSATITGEAGYTVTVYQVATLDLQTGKYTSSYSDVQTELNNSEGEPSQGLLSACDKLTLTGGSDLQFVDGDTVKTFKTSTPGVYYFKWTKYPEGTVPKSITNSVVPLPNYNKTTNTWNATYTEDISSKVEDDKPQISKEITSGYYDLSKTETTASIGDTINFTLTASTVGSTSLVPVSYKIVDTMDKGLTYVDGSVTVTVGGTVLTSSQYSVTTATSGDKTTVTIQLDRENYLNDTSTSYYNTDAKVVVTLSATLNENADVCSLGQRDEENVNRDDLYYIENGAETETKVEGNDVKVYTFQIGVQKIDGTTSSVLSDKAASFKLYSDEECKTQVGSVQSTESGVATFTGLEAGTYYVKESAAPEGYSLNTKAYKVTINGSDGSYTEGVNSNNYVEVPDYPIVVPNTGGAGTIMFYIGGAALIVCAGVLLLVFKKKKAAK